MPFVLASEILHGRGPHRIEVALEKLALAPVLVPRVLLARVGRARAAGGGVREFFAHHLGHARVGKSTGMPNRCTCDWNADSRCRLRRSVCDVSLLCELLTDENVACMTDSFWRGCTDHVVRTACSTDLSSDSWIGCSDLLP
jgi:hypothetical protein